ncbi:MULTISPECIES: restriction endonuclease PLD domain-containing protein [Neisseria]|jgi:type-2 restriction enzyme ngoFVII|uniref:NgoFVII family restriction endonuclease n=1 Tax=Neisseria subflava TaxID=28449 RepID=A0AAW6Y9A9_NEISU|nr:MULTISPECIES: restriction endonuclease PLD domain-containing protein [Neisseria]MDK7241428.1 NgoFVII family restriction endonuclease [Neisseria subflava]OFN19972.1 restriction endonuclease [Neisseria sp. HMSC072B12]OFV31592.1 restriction endonuclease [Neisseria sp. HMSC15G01]
MNTVFSNFYPAQITQKKLNDVWMDLFLDADEVLMATGYVSNDAVIELQRILEQKTSIRTVELLVGMHYLEGFSQPQYRSLCRLNAFLQAEKRGQVYVSPFVKFHGKMYSFKHQEQINGLIGSANLTCFWDNTERTYETMVHLDDFQTASDLHSGIRRIIKFLGKPINQASEPTIFAPHNVYLENCIGVEKIDANKVSELFRQTAQYHFLIPVKTEPKSNLNCFFGKGKNPKKPWQLRSWYEVELIVPIQIVRQEGYPTNRTVKIITDDGWSFSCYSSSKNKGSRLSTENLRSEDDLKTLGKWIKGRLEISGCLKSGEPVTPETLHQYGNDHVEFRSTDDPDVWLLSFKGKN